ncbi:GntR family transcriptional regulator [Acetobacter pomorum]|uniref:GntR family transcriptional regulator n=1 Tax=Acetobacter pomorum TaxID=65959 RepID=A0A2G4R9N0_9PROT|nr:PLP-dependent aminotransferase family protein [Acetobacter pomorum]PHY93286.1 GntR family transcriptional regulator [Acetobacter pomorum]GBR49433.1 transcriptional regulator [Acetobacter pomorum DSM 11825]
MRLQSSWQPYLVDGKASPAERLAEAIGKDILSGKLKVDERLPAHRDLAWRLRIGVGSVTRAYAILERRGLVRGVHGRGMFVAVRQENPETKFDLATNMPPPMFSDRALASTLTRLAKQVDPDLFNVYPPVAGHLEHRRIMAHWLSGLGVDVAPEGLLLTSGAQQALNVALNVVRPAVRYAITEEQTYPGMLGAIHQSRLPVHAAMMDAEGILPAALGDILRRNRPERAVVYLTPTMHNPTTATMELQRRQDIVSLCKKFDALIIEDGVYVAGRDPSRPSFMELAPERTFHVSSLSKILSPGLRIGALVPPARYVEECLPALLASSLMIAPLSYAMMAQWMENGTAESVRNALHREALRRQQLVVSNLPEVVKPRSHAFHVWLPMPAEQAARVTEHARHLGVNLPSVTSFQAMDAPSNTGVRLALGNVPFRKMPEALKRIRSACLLVRGKVSHDTIPIY